MTRRNKPKNKTIVKAIKKLREISTIDQQPACVICGMPEEVCRCSAFSFPNDLDRIQPEQINGNLTIQFPE